MTNVTQLLYKCLLYCIVLEKLNRWYHSSYLSSIELIFQYNESIKTQNFNIDRVNEINYLKIYETNNFNKIMNLESNNNQFHKNENLKKTLIKYF